MKLLVEKAVLHVYGKDSRFRGNDIEKGESLWTSGK